MSTLTNQLIAHANDRGAHATPSGPLLRYRSGQRITRRRYDHIWTRLGQHLPWVAAQGISTHWLCHTTLTWVERNFGYAVACAYAGHNDRGSDAGTTTTYVRADVDEFAAAVRRVRRESAPGVSASTHPRSGTAGWSACATRRSACIPASGD